MKRTITKYEFIRSIKEAGGTFSDAGLEALFNYFEEQEKDTGAEIEFNANDINICFHELTVAELEDYSCICSANMNDTIRDISERTVIIFVEKENTCMVDAENAW